VIGSRAVAANPEIWRKRFEATPYVQRLGCVVESLEPDSVRLRLPNQEAN
jgi:hypothetical protein